MFHGRKKTAKKYVILIIIFLDTVPNVKAYLSDTAKKGQADPRLQSITGQINRPLRNNQAIKEKFLDFIFICTKS